MVAPRVCCRAVAPLVSRKFGSPQLGRQLTMSFVAKYPENPTVKIDMSEGRPSSSFEHRTHTGRPSLISLARKWPLVRLRLATRVLPPFKAGGASSWRYDDRALVMRIASGSVCQAESSPPPEPSSKPPASAKSVSPVSYASPPSS